MTIERRLPTWAILEIAWGFIQKGDAPPVLNAQ
jgi:hypothetical protein